MRKYGFYAALFGIVCMAGFLVYEQGRSNDNNVSQIKLAQEGQAEKDESGLSDNKGNSDSVNAGSNLVDAQTGPEKSGNAGGMTNKTVVGNEEGTGNAYAQTGPEKSGNAGSVTDKTVVGNEEGTGNAYAQTGTEKSGNAGGVTNKTTTDNEDATETATGNDDKLEDAATGTQNLDSDNAKTVSGVAYSFDQEKGIVWPVTGDVVLKYSVDSPVYYETLESFMINEGILIQASEGTVVKCGCDGVVTNVYESDKYGKMIDVSIGDDYSITYGQLKNIRVEVGDDVKVNQDIADVAAPTAYFEKEGSNVYMQVKENDESVDPLLLLE